MNNPTPCRFVEYHFCFERDEWPYSKGVTRPAVVTSIGASDDSLNLFVFFEPEDYSHLDDKSPHRWAVKPCDVNAELRGERHHGCWAWPRS